MTTVSDAVASRFSCRQFLPDKPVPRAVVEDMLRRAERAPSGGNLQPWRCYVVAGSARTALVDAVMTEVDSGVLTEGVAEHGATGPYHVYPPDLTDAPVPYRSRRRAVGKQLYESIDIPYRDRAAKLKQLAKNWRFFDAPVGLIFTIHDDMQQGQFVDLGMYMQNVMLLARERGLHTCAQEAWSQFYATTRRVLRIPDGEMIFCGLALGYADDAAPINSWRSTRDGIASFARLDGFEDNSDNDGGGGAPRVAARAVADGGDREPWSKKHKRITQAGRGGLRFSLSNSFAEPLSHAELVRLTRARGDTALVDAYHDHALGYTPNGGSRDLRAEIAKLYGPSIGADNVLVFAGAQVALQTAAMALASDCHAIVFAPGYQSTVESPRHAGGTVTRVRRTAANGWQIDPREVEAAVRDDTRFMVVNEPFNPGGTVMTRAAQRELCAIAGRHGIHVLSDEVYRLLEHDPRDRIPAMCDAYAKGISCVTLSKPWGGCGISIGWLAFQDLSIKQKLVDVQYFGTACPSRASELQALMTLRAGDAILAKNMAIIRRNFALLEAFMERYRDLFGWVRPRAGAIAFIKFKGPLTTEELGRELAAEGISIKPAYCFSDAVTDDIDYFRVGFGEAIMPKALEAFTAFVEKRKDAWRRGMRTSVERSRL